jgi:two-component system CheB/CheR fusion protein
MPKSIIDAGLAEIIAAAEKLPQRIIDTLHLQQPAKLAVSDVESVDAEKRLRQNLHPAARAHRPRLLFLQENHGLPQDRAPHGDPSVDRIGDYVHHLRENPQESDLLFKELLIGVTNFFRDPATWAYLQEKTLPDLLAATPLGTTLRAWVAGCSSGEEAYSLAIIFRELQEQRKPHERCSLQIFATDLDPDAIEKARRALYPANIAIDVSEARLKRFFVEDGGSFRVAKEIREMVVFAPQNIIMDPPFTKLDILTCRNLLIYLGAELQKKLLPLFHYSLKPGGILLLGSAESIGNFTDLFEPLESKARLFKRSNSLLHPDELEFPTRHFPTKAAPPMEPKPETSTANLQTLADQCCSRNSRRRRYWSRPGRSGLHQRAHRQISGTGRRQGELEHSRDGPRRAASGNFAGATPSFAQWRARRQQQFAGRQQWRLATGRSDHIPIQEPAPLRGMAMLVITDVATPARKWLSKRANAARAGPNANWSWKRRWRRPNRKCSALREEMQTSQEELKSANEELQSTNEELQSTNEELTTSKEEMQSLNEELQTVNVELQSKVDELSSANNDMKNLLNSTDIATIFLDNALHVRRFTTQATRLFKLIPGDVGRRLSDIVTDLDYPGLLQIDAEEVLRTLAFSDREVGTGDGRWFQVKIMPYRTLENVIDGVVITFNDISRAKMLEKELRAVGPAAWLEKLAPIAKPDQPVIVICRSGNRTKDVSQLLSQQAGYTKVYNVKSGIKGWIKEGGAVVPATQSIAACRTAKTLLKNC